LTKNKKGYSGHPETIRWRQKLAALYLRHKKLVEEIEKRGYRHKSALNSKLATGSRKQDIFIDSREKQRKILKSKNCGCRV